jgi:predicted O-methyltransferase YrrM
MDLLHRVNAVANSALEGLSFAGIDFRSIKRGLGELSGARSFLQSQSCREALGSDSIVQAEIARLVKEFNVRTIVETGTNVGASTRFFAELPSGPSVLSIESNLELIAKARANLAGYDTVQLHWGSSDIVLPTLLQDLSLKGPVLFFLDAHWGEHWPLLGELAAIAARPRVARTALLVIHDFKVPGKAFGYDSYGKQDLDLEYVSASIQAINPKLRVHFPEEVDPRGQRRGIAYFLPQD